MSWISVKILPNRKTPYAGKYGVPVLIFDIKEDEDCGDKPREALFDFRKKIFKNYACNHSCECNKFKKYGNWYEEKATHWQPLPEKPLIIKDIRIK